MSKVRQARYWWSSVLLIVQERSAFHRAESQRTDTRAVADPEQEIELLQVSDFPAVACSVRSLSTLHQHLAPTVRRRVHEDAKRLRVARWVLLSFPKRQSRIE